MKTNGLNISSDLTSHLISRRDVLKIGAFTTVSFAAGVYGFEKFQGRAPQEFRGQILGAGSAVGHTLRKGEFPLPSEEIEIETVIVGAGMAGLSAGWWLQKKAHSNFRILELDTEVGGNSRFGQNQISKYPWGAHYVPLPSADSVYVRELFEELGVIEGYNTKKEPIYNELYLCADPEERLLIHGHWQEGLIPQVGLTSTDREQYRQFFQFMEDMKEARGKDGKPAFTIPLAFSSQDPEFLKYDQMSMADFMREKGWSSKYLNWYVTYCCRDDYGATQDRVSAWAGIHYFASRVGDGANADSSTVLTWPEGNGWIAHQLEKKLQSHIQKNALVFSVENQKDLVEIKYFDVTTQKSILIRAKSAILCCPRFVVARLIPELSEKRDQIRKDFQYAPWLVANVSLKNRPESHGAPLSWDNVSFYSESLGYIVATHQSLERQRNQTVLTYYLPLSAKDPLEARREAQSKTFGEWAQKIAHDLSQMHKGLAQEIENIDIWIWGHGMIVPKPGYIWGPLRREAAKSLLNIHFAHSDLSGLSIFEEAQYQGVMAAAKVLKGISST